jgi:hypothetical protein
MAHYAFLNDENIVTEVIVGIDENELIDGIDPEVWYGNQRNQVCKRTSYNNKIRKQYAGIGFTYDSEHDIFIAPQPYSSWNLDLNFDWQPPKPRPDGMNWVWDEEEGDWIEQLS